MPGFGVVGQEASHGFCSPCLGSMGAIFTDLCVLGRGNSELGATIGSGHGAGEAVAPLCSLLGTLC